MGMFVNFNDDPECNWCGKKVWECECDKRPIDPEKQWKMKWSTTEPKVGIGDIICSCVDDVGTIYDEAYVHDIDGENIFVQFLDGKVVKWPNTKLLKVCSVLKGEYHK